MVFLKEQVTEKLIYVAFPTEFLNDKAVEKRSVLYYGQLLFKC